jgi:hypothetical protein
MRPDVVFTVIFPKDGNPLASPTVLGEFGLAFGACGLIVISAAAASFAGGHRAAAIIAGQACLAFCLTYSAAKRDRAGRSTLGAVGGEEGGRQRPGT